MITIREDGIQIAKYTAKELKGMTEDDLWAQYEIIKNLPLNGWTNQMYPENNRAYYKINAERRRREGILPQKREGAFDKYFRMMKG